MGASGVGDGGCSEAPRHDSGRRETCSCRGELSPGISEWVWAPRSLIGAEQAHPLSWREDKVNEDVASRVVGCASRRENDRLYLAAVATATNLSGFTPQAHVSHSQHSPTWTFPRAMQGSRLLVLGSAVYWGFLRGFLGIPSI